MCLHVCKIDLTIIAGSRLEPKLSLLQNPHKYQGMLYFIQCHLHMFKIKGCLFLPYEIQAPGVSQEPFEDNTFTSDFYSSFLAPNKPKINIHASTQSSSSLWYRVSMQGPRQRQESMCGLDKPSDDVDTSWGDKQCGLSHYREPNRGCLVKLCSGSSSWDRSHFSPLFISNLNLNNFSLIGQLKINSNLLGSLYVSFT